MIERLRQTRPLTLADVQFPSSLTTIGIMLDALDAQLLEIKQQLERIEQLLADRL